LSIREKEELFKRGFGIFKKVVADSGILQEYKKREFFESPSEKRRRKKKESNLARKRNRNNKDLF
jgi:ribosomal protein S21